MTGTTLLLRQINPAFIQNGQVTSQAFRPTPAHDLLLSVYNRDLIEPKPAWEHFTTVQKKDSVGVLAVTVSECTELDLPVVESPEVFREHCHVDFSSFTSKKIEQKGKLLRDRATKRDWQYQPLKQAKNC